MSAYLAIIVDGFRQAFRTWILWVLLIVITLGLIIVAPVGYREDDTVGLSLISVRDWGGLIARVRNEGQRDTLSTGRKIWEGIDPKLQKRIIRESGGGERSGGNQRPQGGMPVPQFQAALDKILKDPKFHDPELWRLVQSDSAEASMLLEKAKDESTPLSDAEKRRLNRLLVEASYPDLVLVSTPTSLTIQYLGQDRFFPLPVRREQFNDIIRSTIAGVLGWVIGGAGVLVAILVTAPIIPQMFDPGSLHLLLSKPIHRTLLFLAKFLGGCAFILILVTYLIGGLWLILGFRFDIWDPRFLWSIPIYTFVFAIYYSVSALGSVVYRGSILSSAIMSIALSCIFWLVCFLVGLGKVGVESTILNKTRTIALVPAGDDLMSVNEMGMVSRWDEDTNQWSEIFESDEQRQAQPVMFLVSNVPAQLRPIGPIYDAKNNRLLSVHRSFRDGNQVVYVGTANKEWKAVRGATAPPGTLELFVDPDGSTIAVSSLGIYRLQGDPLKSSESLRVLGMRIPMTSGGPFRSIGPDPNVVLTQPLAIAMHPDNGNLAMYSRGKLTRLEKNDKGKYEVIGETVDVVDEPQRTALMAWGGDTLLMAWDDGRVEARDATSLEVVAESSPEDDAQPRFVKAAPGGRRFAIVFHNGAMWTYDEESKSFERPRIRGQKDISAVYFPDGERVMVVDRTSRVTEYEVDSWQTQNTFQPTMGLVESVYRWVLVPLYTIFPKPGELNKTLQYLISDTDVESSEDLETDLSTSQTKLRPWQPFWSSLIFMAVVLAIACIYIERQQF